MQMLQSDRNLGDCANFAGVGHPLLASSQSVITAIPERSKTEPEAPKYVTIQSFDWLMSAS